MGFFSSLLSGLASGSDSSSDDSAEDGDQVSCATCGDMVDEDTVDGAGNCEDCSDEEYDKYCCGRLYDEGETVCASCGDPL